MFSFAQYTKSNDNCRSIDFYVCDWCSEVVLPAFRFLCESAYICLPSTDSNNRKFLYRLSNDIISLRWWNTMNIRWILTVLRSRWFRMRIKRKPENLSSQPALHGLSPMIVNWKSTKNQQIVYCCHCANLTIVNEIINPTDKNDPASIYLNISARISSHISKKYWNKLNGSR